MQPDERGFGLIEAIVAVVIVVAIGLGAWYGYDHHHQTEAVGGPPLQLPMRSIYRNGNLDLDSWGVHGNWPAKYGDVRLSVNSSVLKNTGYSSADGQVYYLNSANLLSTIHHIGCALCSPTHAETNGGVGFPFVVIVRTQTLKDVTGAPLSNSDVARILSRGQAVSIDGYYYEAQLPPDADELPSPDAKTKIAITDADAFYGAAIDFVRSLKSIP